MNYRVNGNRVKRPVGKLLRMRRDSMRTWFSAIIMAAWLVVSTAAASNDSHTQLNTMISQEWEYELSTHPERATEIGDNRFNDRLRDYSPAAFARELDHRGKALAEFQALDANGLSKEDQLNRMLMIRTLQTRIGDGRLKNWEMPVNQMGGPPLEYAGLAKDV